MARPRTQRADCTVDLFATLPPELIEIISEHLAAATDILSFRLTCRNLHACSRRAFERRWVLDRPFLLFNKASLDTLRSIANDPKRSRRLKCINLSLAGLADSDDDYERRKETAGSERREHDRAVRAQLRAQRATYRQRSEEEFILHHDPHESASIQLAHTIFDLREQGFDPAINVTTIGFDVDTETVHPEDPPAWGYERICRELGYRHAMDISIWDGHAMFHVFQTLLRIGGVASSLALGNILNSIPVRVMDKRWLRIVPVIWEGSFECLTVLRVSLSAYRPQDLLTPDIIADAKRDCESFVESFRAAMRSASNLKTLGLTTGTGPLDELYLAPKVWSALHDLDGSRLMLPRLENLELNGLAIGALKLYWFVGWHRRTLRTLDVRWVKENADYTEEDSAVMFGGEETPAGLESPEFSAGMRSYIEKRVGPDCRVLRWHHVYDGLPWVHAERTKGVLY